MIIISKLMCMSSHHIVYLKLTQYVTYVSVKLGKIKIKMTCLIPKCKKKKIFVETIFQLV